MEDVGKIAAGLTMAQRRALLAFDGFDYEASNKFHPPRDYPRRRTVIALIEAGLYERVAAPKHHGNHSFMCWERTPLGLAVKAHLEAQS